MKIKFYIVTYNREDHLNKTLESLFSTDIDEHDVEVFIVNNHSSFQMNEKFASRVTVLHNVLRPDFSTGHLSRNYNEILMHGFRDLNNPDCNILMHSHDDNFFHPELFKKMIEEHNKYNFITFSWGCGFCSYLSDAVKKIGMWDERFCTIGYHEGDYFLRALKYNEKHTSINDWEAARRLHNPINEVLCHKQPESVGHNDAHKNSWKHYSICRRLWEKKWPNWKNDHGKVSDTSWHNRNAEQVPRPSIPMYMLYPYFEKNIEDIPEKYYDDIDTHGNAFF